MNIYVVEDDMNIINILTKIIEERNLGNVIGYSQDGISGEKELVRLNPDIALVDLLMPGKDGLNLIRDVKKINSEIQFIMISQVSSKDMIGRAYEYGVEYYINKPINALEIDNILRKVIEKVEMKKTMDEIQKFIKIGDIASRKNIEEDRKEDIERNINNIMQRIGIVGEIGSEDIVNIISYLIEEDKSMKDFTITELLSKFSENPKSLEQRIRRTAAIGLSNLAYLGLEDYMDQIFVEYSNSLYSFKQVRTEMDYIKGKSKKKGTVNLKKFIEGILFYSLQ